MKAYKGFNEDLTCRGFQYEVGKEYEEEKAELCNSGFHACEDPLDCFAYYPPASSVYHDVELDDVSDEKDNDTKRVGKRIKVGAELNVAAICKAKFEYVKEHTTFEYTDPEQATAGDRGAATSRGSVCVGENGCGLVRGNSVKAKGGIGAVLTICEESEEDYSIKWCKTFVVDGKRKKPDVWYCIKGGKVVVADV